MANSVPNVYNESLECAICFDPLFIEVDDEETGLASTIPDDVLLNCRRSMICPDTIIIGPVSKSWMRAVNGIGLHAHFRPAVEAPWMSKENYWLLSAMKAA